MKLLFSRKIFIHLHFVETICINEKTYSSFVFPDELMEKSSNNKSIMIEEHITNTCSISNTNQPNEKNEYFYILPFVIILPVHDFIDVVS